jgi:CRP-like cAMP-binding protein
MPERGPYGPRLPECLAPVRTSGAKPVPPPPRDNRLLAALPLADYNRLLPCLEPVPLPLGWTIYGPHDREKYLYFVTAGIVSRLYVMTSGASAEFAITGSEGVIGVAAFLGGKCLPTQSVVLSAGHSHRLAADVLKGEFEQGGPLQHLLLRYTEALIVQTGQVAVCNRRHSLEQRLCRWLLSCLDRLPSGELTMTQELVAHALGVRREGVTEAIGDLQKAGALHCSRGRMAVLDRSALQAHACECYAVVKKEYDRLLYPAIGLAADGLQRRCRQHPMPIGEGFVDVLPV